MGEIWGLMLLFPIIISGIGAWELWCLIVRGETRDSL